MNVRDNWQSIRIINLDLGPCITDAEAQVEDVLDGCAKLAGLMTNSKRLIGEF